MYEWSGSHDQGGHHAHIYGKKHSKIFSYRTYSALIMKFDMEPYELKLYTVYIKYDPELTLTNFTAISNFEKLVSVLIAGPDIR